MLARLSVVPGSVSAHAVETVTPDWAPVRRLQALRCLQAAGWLVVGDDTPLSRALGEAAQAVAPDQAEIGRAAREAWLAQTCTRRVAELHSSGRAAALDALAALQPELRAAVVAPNAAHRQALATALAAVAAARGPLPAAIEALQTAARVGGSPALSLPLARALRMSGQLDAAHEAALCATQADDPPVAAAAWEETARAHVIRGRNVEAAKASVRACAAATALADPTLRCESLRTAAFLARVDEDLDRAVEIL